MPDLPGFCSPTGYSRSESVATDRLINMYIEPLSNNAKELCLYSVPGLQPVAELPSGPIRGLYETSTSRVFAVTSTTLFEIFQGFTFLSRGSIPNGTSYVSMCDNGAYLILSVEGAGLVYNLSTNALTTIAPEDPALTFGGSRISTAILSQINLRPFGFGIAICVIR